MSIDCNWFEVPNPNRRKIYLIENQDDKMLGLFMFFKIIVCKDDDFSAFTTTKFMNENFVKCTRMYTRSTKMGLIVATINRVLVELFHLTLCLRELNNF